MLHRFTAAIFDKRMIFKVILLGITLCCVSILLLLVEQQKIQLPSNDFTLYWSSSKLLLAGSNPYDPSSLYRYQMQEAENVSGQVLMYYPPWSLLILLPLGLLKHDISQVLWLLVNTGVIFACTDKIWVHLGCPTRYRWVAWIIAFSFGPTFAALGYTGQITPLIFLGFAGFLLLIDQSEKDWITGLFLLFTAIKPQVPYLFFILLFLWAIHQHRWKLLLSFCMGLSLAILLGTLLDSQIVIHFLQNLTHNTPVAWATPTIGTYLRYYFGVKSFGIQFIPPLVTSIGSIVYWWKHREQWSWTRSLPWILFLCAFTSPYTWTYDFIPLIIPILIGFSLVLHHQSKLVAFALVCIYLLINGLYWWLHLKYTDFDFLWFAPALLIWYIMVRAVAKPVQSISYIP